MRRILLLLPVLLLSACSGRDGTPPLDGPPQDGGIGDIVASIAVWAASIATGLLFICIVAVVLGYMRKTAISGIVACLAIIVTAPIVGWVGAHLWIFAGGVVILALAWAGFWVWRNRDRVDDALGLDILPDQRTQPSEKLTVVAKNVKGEGV